MAEYLVLIYGDESTMQDAEPAEMGKMMEGHRVFGQKYAAALRGGNALQASGTATTVRLSGWNLPTDTLTINASAFMAEIVRAGIQSIGRDQWDAARGLGMGYPQVMRWVVIPQAFRVMIPPGVGLLIGLIKDSSVISVISYLELTRVGQILPEKTFLSFQVFGIVAALYFALCYPLSRVALYVERRLKVGG